MPLEPTVLFLTSPVALTNSWGSSRLRCKGPRTRCANKYARKLSVSRQSVGKSEYLPVLILHSVSPDILF